MGRVKFYLYLVGAFLTAITLAGALWGYIRGYNRFMKANEEPPELYPLRPIVKFAMVAGAVLIWFVVIVAFIGLGTVATALGFQRCLLPISRGFLYIVFVL